MVYTKKTNSAAFGEILAGLGAGADRPAAGRASPSSDAKTPPGMDVSWIQSARMRASAAQMAQRVAAAAEPKQTGAGERPRRKLEDSMESWRSATPDPSRPASEPYPGEADAPQAPGPSGPAGATAMPEPPPGTVEQAPLPAAAVRPNPVHALWRLLGHIPGGWRARAGVLASALGSVRSAGEQPATVQSRPRRTRNRRKPARKRAKTRQSPRNSGFARISLSSISGASGAISPRKTIQIASNPPTGSAPHAA